MSSDHRVLMQPAYVLHQRPYRDSSAIVELFTPEHGRVGVVAKGVKRPKSPWRGLLQAFQPLLVSWSGRGELATLIGVDTQGETQRLPPAVIASGFYLNELLMRLLHRHDAHVELFSCYDSTVRHLAALTSDGEPAQAGLEVALRSFEIQLLASLGYGLVLDHDVASGAPIEREKTYRYQIERGPVADAGNGEGIVVHGSALMAMETKCLDTEQDRREAKRLMRAALGRHLGDKPLFSRQLLLQGSGPATQRNHDERES
jgi:DNA repair protein RecO (recombination protein O)